MSFSGRMMSKWVLKYNRNKHQFNLNIGGRHFFYRKNREEEVREIDDWLINNQPIENRAYITFTDDCGVLHEKVSVKTSGLMLWYNNDEDWKSFMWELPTKEGTIFIKSVGGKVRYSKDGDYKTSVEVNPSKVVVMI